MLLGCGSPEAFARNTISIWFCRSNVRAVKMRNCSSSRPISSQNSRRNAASACSPASTNPPGIPQPDPGRKRCLIISTCPSLLRTMPAAVTVNFVLAARTDQRRKGPGSRCQMFERRFFNVRLRSFNSVCKICEPSSNLHNIF